VQQERCRDIAALLQLLPLLLLVLLLLALVLVVHECGVLFAAFSICFFFTWPVVSL
jgi:hypothetical protein